MMPPPPKQRKHLSILKNKRLLTSIQDEKIDSSTSASEESEKQTEDYNHEDPFSFKYKITSEHIADLFELCAGHCSLKYISVLLYISLKHFGVSWKNCSDFLSDIGSMKAQTAHKWAQIFISGDLEMFLDESRGGKHNPEFYDYFPEVENQARQFALERCSQKSADFKVVDLANFIDEKYYELTKLQKETNDVLIRSISSCRLDLRRWGAQFKDNSQRPYFEGHERSDVIEHRQQFIEYFLSRKDNYYTVSNDEKPVWVPPREKRPCILLCKCLYCSLSIRI